MKTISLLSAGLLAMAGTAHATIPQLNASCPGNISVHADKGGPVYIDGKEARLKRFNDNYYEATGSGVTLSLSISPDGTPSVSYTKKGGVHGVCSKLEMKTPDRRGVTQGVSQGN